MWFLEIIESALPAIPWLCLGIITLFALAVVCTIAGWVMAYVWVEVFDRGVDWNLEPAGGWDPADLGGGETNGQPT